MNIYLDAIVRLLACDQQQSVLRAHADGEEETKAYSPYGHHAMTGSPGFNGELTEPTTGHYALGNGYRAYNPVLMRFNSPDSWSPFGNGGSNPYTYCLGDPVNCRDPSGHVAIMAMLPGLLKSLAAVGRIQALSHPKRTWLESWNKQRVYTDIPGSSLTPNAVESRPSVIVWAPGKSGPSSSSIRAVDDGGVNYDDPAYIRSLFDKADYKALKQVATQSLKAKANVLNEAGARWALLTADGTLERRTGGDKPITHHRMIHLMRPENLMRIQKHVPLFKKLVKAVRFIRSSTHIRKMPAKRVHE